MILNNDGLSMAIAPLNDHFAYSCLPSLFQFGAKNVIFIRTRARYPHIALSPCPHADFDVRHGDGLGGFHNCHEQGRNALNIVDTLGQHGIHGHYVWLIRPIDHRVFCPAAAAPR